MLVRARLKKPFYDLNGRKYIDLDIDGSTLKVKVPFRYNRVMCDVIGHVPIQDYKEGLIVEAVLQKKLWEGETHWILHTVRELTSELSRDEPE